jgi:proteasome activator subunit 4
MNISWNWRDFYNLLLPKLCPKKMQRILPSSRILMSHLIQLLRYINRFFYNSTASEEIFREFYPSFYPLSPRTLHDSQAFFVALMPTNCLLASDFFWIDTVFYSWSSIGNSRILDRLYMYLFSRIAKDQYGKNNCVFKQAHMEKIYDVGLRMMQLPIGSGLSLNETGEMSVGSKATLSHGGFPGKKNATEFPVSALVLSEIPIGKDHFYFFAQFIIYTCYNDESSINLLRFLINAIEPFYHPSNHGRWTSALVLFAESLSECLLERIEGENNKCEYPDNFFLTNEYKSKIVEIISPVLLLSMFGKDGGLVQASQKALSFLAWVKPEHILPAILERVYPSLSNLVETHRTSSAITTLGAVAIPLLDRTNYKDGGLHIVPLIQLCLPGIDLNDIGKTVGILNFLSKIFICMPLVDITDCPEDDVALSTLQLEDCIILFLQKIFQLLSHLPNSEARHSEESTLVEVVIDTCDVLFNHMSKKFIELATKIIVDFISSNIHINAQTCIGSIVASLVHSWPDHVFPLVLDLCVFKIRAELDHGAGSKPSNTDDDRVMNHHNHNSDFGLLWYLGILRDSISNGVGNSEILCSEALLNTILDVWDRGKACKIYTAVSFLICGLLHALTQIYVLEYNSFPPSVLQNPEWQKKSFEEWGNFTKYSQKGSVDIAWHIPSEREKAFALRICKIFDNELLILNNLVNSNTSKSVISKESVNQFCKSLTLLDIGGTFQLFAAPCISKKIEYVCDNNETFFKNARVPDGYEVLDLNDESFVYKTGFENNIAACFHKMSDFFRIHEDYSLPISLLVSAMGNFLTGYPHGEYSELKNEYKIRKQLLKTLETSKKRHLITKRLRLLNYARKKYNDTNTLTKSYVETILNDIFYFCLVPYAEVRMY